MDQLGSKYKILRKLEGKKGGTHNIPNNKDLFKKGCIGVSLLPFIRCRKLSSILNCLSDFHIKWEFSCNESENKEKYYIYTHFSILCNINLLYRYV